MDTRVAALAIRIALNCLRAGTDVIIDEGFWVRSQREEIRKKLEQAGGTVKMYYLKNTHETMKQRVLERNKKLSGDSFDISHDMYESYKKYFEEPTSDEDCIVIDNQIESQT